jgi:hypothetical protein
MTALYIFIHDWVMAVRPGVAAAIVVLACIVIVLGVSAGQNYNRARE